MIQKLRITSLLLIHIFILLHVYYFGSETIGSIDFQEFFHSFIKLGVINAGVLLVIFAFLFTLIFGRFFCGWACHFGAIQELCWYILKKLNITPKTIDSKLVTILPLIILLNFYVIPNFYFAYQNQWQLSISLNEPEIWEFLPGFIIGILTFFIDGFLIVYFLGKKGFCRFICPWGAFLKVPTSLALFKVRKTGDCTHCHVCTTECPVGIDVSYEINEFDKVVNSNCTSCMNCTTGCPSNALSYKFLNPLKEEYKLNQFLPKKEAFTHSNISSKFKNLRKFDILVLPLTIILGFSFIGKPVQVIDNIYSIGDFMAYGIALIMSYITIVFLKNYSPSKQLIITVITLIILSWNLFFQYSIWMGKKNYYLKNYKAGIYNLEKSINLYHRNYNAHLYLSKMYFITNDFEKAKKHALIAHEINSNEKTPMDIINSIQP